MRRRTAKDAIAQGRACGKVDGLGGRLFTRAARADPTDMPRGAGHHRATFRTISSATGARVFPLALMFRGATTTWRSNLA